MSKKKVADVEHDRFRTHNSQFGPRDDVVELDQYWRALDEFVHRFSQVEEALQLVLWHYAHVPIPTARALFSGTRVDAAMSQIRRLQTVKPHITQLELDQVEHVFTQLGKINKLRNDVVHFGTQTHRPDAFTVTNQLLALTPDKIRETPISVEILKDLSSDLVKIATHLMVFRLPPVTAQPRSQKIGKILNAAWRYTPPGPG